MRNLHRELASISDSAWAQIEEEAPRAFRRLIARQRQARLLVDLQAPFRVTAEASVPLPVG
jgi:uncharacterized linocin/CFP29 family protein